MEDASLSVWGAITDLKTYLVKDKDVSANNK